MTDQLLTIPEAAAQLRVSRRTVERLIAVGRIRPTKVGARTLVRQREIDAYVAAQTSRRVA